MGIAVLLAAACGRGTPGRRTGAGVTAAAPGEIAPTAVDTSLIPRHSPDSTGKLGAPGYGFRTGGNY